MKRNKLYHISRLFKYDSVTEIKRMEDLEKCKIVLAELFGNNDTLLAELVELRSSRIRFLVDQKPLRVEQENHYKETIKTPFFVSLLEDKNNSMKPRKRTSDKQSILCDNPEVAPDNIFGRIE